MLTPVTLWQDFDDSLPANEELLSEKREGGVVWRDVYIYGRNVGSGADERMEVKLNDSNRTPS